VATTQPAIYPASFEIVVPARNEADRLPEGLAALCRKAATLPLRTAILVVDSANTGSRIPGGGQLPGRHLPLNHQELPTADLRRLAAGATTHDRT
jgi:hypothetical protein